MHLRLCLFFVLIIQGTVLANTDIQWLEKQSMLYQAKLLTKAFSKKKNPWQESYACPKTLEAIDLAENWFTSYPASIVTQDESVLAYLASKELWSALQQLGIQALHTAPMQIAGGLQGKDRTISTDGGFDRISIQLDPEYGSYTEYLRMVKTAKKHGAIIIGDLVPAHSGIGPDFHLALAAYQDYPGIYHMVEIHPRDWRHLPKVKEGLSKNLTPKQVDLLKKKGYIVGKLDTQIFFHPDRKISNWDVTKPIEGVDGKTRRWVYLHYFKSSQPSYNWLDPSFAVQRIVAADALFCLFVLKNTILRLDANSFLGIESVEHSKKAWSEAHPLATDATHAMGMLIRKFGGYCFQELNLGCSSLKAFSRFGADLSYDFLTRAAYVNALIHGNCDLLKICYDLMRTYEIDPRILIHAMQNHDELNYELKYLKECAHKKFYYHGEYLLGADLRKKIQKQDLAICGETPFYNSVSPEGICSTMVGICASALGIKNVHEMTKEEELKVKKAHLLLAFFNAMQPGVFALSSWDIVGALPLTKKAQQNREAKQDPRWRLRGAVDLLHCCDQTYSKTGAPKTTTLYSPVCLQLKNPDSFAAHIRAMLLARKTAHIAKATWLGFLPTKHPGLFILLNRLPATQELQITACNFSQETIVEKIEIQGTKATSAINLLSRKAEKKDFHTEVLELTLDALEGKAIVFQQGPNPIQ